MGAIASRLGQMGQTAAARMGELVTRGGERQSDILRAIAEARAQGDIAKANQLSQMVQQLGQIPQQVVGFQEMMRRRKREEEKFKMEMDLLPLEKQRIIAQTEASGASARKSAMDSGRAERKEKEDREESQIKKFSEIMATSTDQNSYRLNLQLAAEQGVVPPEHFQRMQGVQFTSEMGRRFKEKAMGQEKFAEEQGKVASAAETVRHNRAVESQKVETMEDIDLTPLATVPGFEKLQGIKVPKGVADNLVNALAQAAKQEKPPQPNYEQTQVVTALASKLGREPTAQEISTELERVDRESNASRAMVQGLTPGQFNRVQMLASQFDSNPMVKQLNESITRFEGLKSIINAGLGGPGDLTTVFEFMRALDPTSVVRESEYETARKSGNIFSGMFARFNGYFKPEGGFLPPRVREDFVKALSNKLDIQKKQVKNVYNDFGRRVEKITGQPGSGTEYLTDYTEMSGGGDAQPQGGGMKSKSDEELMKILTGK